MAKRILWKKGMRLTDEVLTLSDKCTEELVSNAFALGACGRMGLIPSCRKFSISLDINNDVKEITFENNFFYGSYDESDKTFYDIQRGKRVRYYLTPECND